MLDVKLSILFMFWPVIEKIRLKPALSKIIGGCAFTINSVSSKSVQRHYAALDFQKNICKMGRKGVEEQEAEGDVTEQLTTFHKTQ